MKIDGDWYNELGSKMSLAATGDNVSGTYETSVGTAAGAYSLVGRFDSTSTQGSKNIGFVVSWTRPGEKGVSVTAWSGQLQQIDGEEVLVTTWILSDETPPWDAWKSTLVGANVFRRKRPITRELDIAGTWYNELGSVMNLVRGADPLEFQGSYHTAVGDADGLYDLVGRSDGGQIPCQNVGFAVSWQNSKRNADSVTVWTGQLRFVDGEEVLTATWLLTVETTAGNNWKSTMTGRDVFRRTPFPAAAVAFAKKSKLAAHPKAAAG